MTFLPANGLHRRVRGEWVFLFLPLLLYGVTIAHDIGLPDSAIVIDAMRTPVLSSSAVNHNLNNLVGYVANLLPLRNIALKSNLVSVVYGTAAIGLFHLLLLKLTVSRLTAGLCAGILMVSHSLWWHSTQVENYALSVVFLLACLLLVERDGRNEAGPPRLRYVCGVFFLAGLSLFNHLQNGALSVAAVVYLVAVRRFSTAGTGPNRLGRVLPAVLAAYGAGLLPFVLVLAMDWGGSGGDAAATLGALTGGGFRHFMFSYDLVPALRRLGDWVFMQFPSPFLVFIPVGALLLLLGGSERDTRMESSHRPGFAAFLWTVFIVNTGFFMGYRTWDQFSFYLVSFVCLAVMGAVGAEACVKRAPVWGRRSLWLLLAVSLILPPIVYARISHWAKDPEGYWGRRYHAAAEAYRGRYDLVGLYTDPIRHDRGTVARWIHLMLARLPPDALLIDDVSGYYQIEYFRKYYAWRPDLRLLLLQPLEMEGWGSGLEEIEWAVSLTSEHVFIVATNGPCEAVVQALTQQGRTPVKFPLSEEHWVYELVAGERTGSR